ncbi:MULTISPECIES: LacI family DNA-binding transcriptional regulator [Thermomonospora]|uniref:DNA-binding LacI/PurR family transcriptional regulator n=1 Tax=Thermomonospora cellulosilytica TaxID=1411118 RepID=A0A7W3MVC7_9ACTN|nr:MULTISPECIES: LacI family DNA-binding transcriptional regulator [Thermomonospora]MBA9002553.1 DNA-binding LacI/PurR family transcriptional regulator [Thermomonospora cellulosilytica]
MSAREGVPPARSGQGGESPPGPPAPRPATPKPTIRNVAERAGVSKSLVSLVMRGSPHVSERRRQAVLKAARELGYRPNAVARSLVEGRTRLIGAIVADLHNPFFAEFLDGLQESLHGEGLRMLVGSGRWDPLFEAEAVEAFLEMRVDGLVLLSVVPDSLREAAASVPVVVVGERDVAGVDIVVDDDELGASLAVDHLVRLGHRRIAHIEGAPSTTARYRRAGYENAMRKHDLADQIVVETGDFTEEGGYRAARSLLSRPDRPTAIFAPNDLVATGALSAADELGLGVPADVSIVGYDNTHLAAIRHISLTSVDQPRRDMGRIAAEMLCARIEDPSREARQNLVVPHLVVRSTTGPAPS